MKHKYLNLAIVALACVALTSCWGNKNKPNSTPTQGTATLFCDDSFQNIMEQEIDVYEYIYPKAHILANYGPEGVALDSLMSLNTRTIVIPRDLTKDEVEKLKKKRRTPRSSRIAVDAVALIINPENPMDYLSMKEIAAILSGETTNWNDLNPHYPDRPITVVFDNSESSMVKYMSDSLLNGNSLGSTAAQTGSIKGVIDAIKTNKNALGVIGVSWLTSDLRSTTPIDSLTADLNDEESVPDMGDINERLDNSGVKVLGVMRSDDRRAYYPYQQNIYDGTYPLTRQIFMITLASSGSTAGGFYSFVTGYLGQKLIMKTGVMPARANINVKVELVP